jgi:2-keto-myo-inositol isomerase
MTTPQLSRRAALASGSLLPAGVLAATSLAMPATSQAAEETDPRKRVRYCLNTSTIREKHLPLPELVDLVAKAGYQGIEPWMGEIEGFLKSGGKLSDLRKRIADSGLKVESAIGFANWITDDDGERAKGLEQAKRDMGWIAELGGTRIAAPPAGATDNANLDLRKAGERYRKLCEIGASLGVAPQAEVWGFSKCLSRLSETMYVVLESGHPMACVLPDVYHLFKGDTAFESLAMVSGTAVQVFHMNDYPKLDRTAAKDADRVYPGDGVAPLGKILGTLFKNGFHGALSLELFNPEYWKQDPLLVAKTGLEKMKAAVASAEI